MAPYKDHMETVNRVLSYLKATASRCLRYKKTDRRCVEVYAESDWIGSIVDRKFT